MQEISTYPPNVKYVDDFVKIQEQARENNKGFWNNDTYNGEVIETVKTEGKYVGSIASDKYHYTTCRHAKI